MFSFLSDEHPFFSSPLIIAHRGASSIAPENTFSAFSKAAELGATSFELDIQLSKDLELVVIHDFNLKRTTNFRGNISQFNWDELQKADAGSWKNETFKGECLPLLRNVLLSFPNTAINIEIKKESVSLSAPIIEEKLISLIQELDCFNRIFVSSFSYKALRTVKQIEPRLKTGLLFNRKFFGKEDVVKLTQLHHASFFHCSYREATEQRIQLLNEAQIPIFVYTVNDVSLAKKLWNMGVQGFFTDNPKLLLDAFA
ncbi:glycerophosphodiester phosphodiesterase [bacterium]|nr:MAG: glycerophosphodiester phosphodiesterase [bacterium]